jgi:hypothetical protein
MKVDIENVEMILLERKVEPLKVAEILKDLAQAVEEEKAERKDEAADLPKLKWEHLIILDDPDKKLAGTDFVGWVVNQKEGTDAGLVLSKLADAAKTQNESGKRKKKSKIEGFKDLFTALKPKWLKEKGIRIKTKYPVRVLTVNGKNLL